MGYKKKLRSLEYQNEQLAKEIKTGFDELMVELDKKEKNKIQIKYDGEEK